MTKEHIKNNESPLELFRKEIQNWIDEESSKGAEANPHAKDISVKYLTDEDRDWWEKVKNFTATNKELVEYNRDLVRARESMDRLDPVFEEAKKAAASRLMFWDMMLNVQEKNYFNNLKKAK